MVKFIGASPRQATAVPRSLPDWMEWKMFPPGKPPLYINPSSSLEPPAPTASTVMAATRFLPSDVDQLFFWFVPLSGRIRAGRLAAPPMLKSNSAALLSHRTSSQTLLSLLIAVRNPRTLVSPLRREAAQTFP